MFKIYISLARFGRLGSHGILRIGRNRGQAKVSFDTMKKDVNCKLKPGKDWLISIENVMKRKITGQIVLRKLVEDVKVNAITVDS